MKQAPDSVEKIIGDEQFLAWYLETDQELARMWEIRNSKGEIDAGTLAEAIELMEQVRIAEAATPEAQAKKAEAALWERINGLTEEKEESAPIRINSWYKKPLQVAAVLLLVAGTGWMANLYLNPKTTELKTDFGQIAKEKLPDGSVITLNGNSRLKYQHANLLNPGREVWMEGEGFFEVQSTPQKDRFTVHLDNLDVIVTGTQFNIHKRPYKTEILLTEGSIELKSSATGELMKLVPGESATLEKGNIVRKSGNIPQVTGWKERKFIFENTSLEEIARSVEALYGIKVRIEGDTTSRKTISAILPADNLDIFVQSLEATQEFTVQRDGMDVLIGPAAR